LLQHLEGETQYQARLDICPSTPGCSNLRIESQLRGVTAQFPVPFAKTAEQLQPLSIGISLAENPSLRVRYAQQLDFAMPISSPFSGAELVFGSDQPPAVSRGDGLWIRGHLDEVGVAPWQTFISQTFLHPDPSVTRSTTDSPDPAALLKQVQLYIDRLNYGAFQVESLQLALTPDEEHWGLTLDSPVIRGRVLLPMAEGLVQVELEHLHIPKSDPATISEPVATVPFDRSQDLLLDFDPSTLPGAQVSINALSHGDRRLGRWRFELQPYRKGVLVKGIDAQVGSLGVIAELDWGYQNKHHSSYIDLSLSAVYLGAVMQEWGATPNISTESAELKGQFIWQGSPLAFNRDTLDGETRLQLNNGRIRNSGGGTQVVKIFSLFNTSTLWRRLSLDFSDLAQDEISFESISGHYRISDAVATSIVPLTVVGPTIGLEFEGTVDLYNETLSQRMLVSLPISENLPIAAVFLATPQIAGAMFLVEKLIGKQLSKFTSVRYSIDGLWSEPKMELIKAAAPPQQMDIQN